MNNNVSPELAMVQDFLAGCLPFSDLALDDLADIASQISITYQAKGETLLPDKTGHNLLILRKGALELQGKDGKLIDRLSEKDSVNLNALAADEPKVKVIFIEDALLYSLEEELYYQLRKNYRQVDRFFNSQRDSRLRRAARTVDSQQYLLQEIGDLIEPKIISCKATDTIAFAASKMTDNRVSSLLVLNNSELLGIVTDRDLRSRVIAEQRPYDTEIGEVMTPYPWVLASTATVFDAMLLMSDSGIHHIPVLEENQPIGVISTSDLVRARQRDPVYLAQKISRENTVEGLAEVAKELPELVVKLVNDGARASQISQLLCVISDSITRRLLELAEQQLGEPPVPYCWLAFGSQARQEIALGGDQDNTLVIDDSYTPAHQSYFEQLATLVCDGLHTCGYPYCKGDIMATNPEWRMPLAQWKTTVSQWVRSPTDKAVMRVSIFFDLRCVAGDAQLADALQTHMLETVAPNSIFLAALTRNALSARPPLGFFRRFVLEHDGEHEKVLNLKKRGILPIVNVVRVHALANQVEEVNTVERLNAFSQDRIMTLKDARNLEDAFNFIIQIRLRQQCLQLSASGKVSNAINPDNLTHLEKNQLREAFSVVNEAQDALALNYTAGLNL